FWSDAIRVQTLRWVRHTWVVYQTYPCGCVGIFTGVSHGEKVPSRWPSVGAGLLLSPRHLGGDAPQCPQACGPRSSQDCAGGSGGLPVLLVRHGLERCPTDVADAQTVLAHPCQHARTLACGLYRRPCPLALGTP